MFANQKTIFFITKNKITVSTAFADYKAKERIIGQYSYTATTLDNVLLKLKSNISQSIRILLSEDFAFVVSITLPSSSDITKDAIRQKAQGLIPEDLNVTVWDFKEIKTTTSIINPTTTIQVVAVVRALFEQLSKSLIKAGFHVEAIEPLSYSLARFTKQQEKPFLLVFVADETLLTLATKEIVLATERLSFINQTAINQFISFAKEKFSIEIKNVIFCGNTKGIDVKQFSNANVKAEVQNISPVVSLALKEDIKGKDEDVLNLDLIRNLHKQNSLASSNAKDKTANAKPVSSSGNYLFAKKKFPKKIMILAGFITIIIVVASFMVYKNKSLIKIEESTKTVLPSPTISTKISPTHALEPTATPTAKIDLSKYTITILNGTGRAGEATKTEDLLKNNGFNVVKTGNAETFDYEKTQVRFKEKVPNELILLLDKSLKTLYDFSIGKKLEEKEETDILIIIGKSTKQ